MIRNFKPAYELYNFFQKSKLQHNVPLYRKIGLNKKYYSSISSEDFKGIDESLLRNEPSLSIGQTKLYQSLDQKSKLSIQSFDKQGFSIIENYLDSDQVNRINETIDKLQQDGSLKFKYGNKLMFAIHHSDYLNKLWSDTDLVELLSCLIKGNAELFQSINFIKGSEQKTHSDSIHMTTFPLGGLLGVWLALEDIHADNGPLHYYPGSHKLPYYLNGDYDNVGNRLWLGKNGYKAYEQMIEQKIKETPMEKKTFHANKGDLLIWHANLFHGGNPHNDPNTTRKSMVMHYFDSNRICYHEITQRPALM